MVPKDVCKNYPIISINYATIFYCWKICYGYYLCAFYVRPILNCLCANCLMRLFGLLVGSFVKYSPWKKASTPPTAKHCAATSGARLLQICSDGLVRDICKIKLWGFPGSWVLNCYIISIHTIYEFLGNLWSINGGFWAAQFGCRIYYLLPFYRCGHRNYNNIILHAC